MRGDNGHNKTVNATFSQVNATGQIAPASTTCQQFRDGTALSMYPVQYRLKGRVINQVNPGVFLYYSKITLPEGAFSIAVLQSNNTDGCGAEKVSAWRWPD